MPDKSLTELGWSGGPGGIGAYPPTYIDHYNAKHVHVPWRDSSLGGTVKADVNGGTAMKLYTGGKAGIKRKSLIHITGKADQYGEPPGDPWMHTPVSSVEATKIQVLGWWLFGRQNLDPNGDLYVALPDNAVKDLNLRVPGVKHYGAWASATRHKLVHETLHPALTDTNLARTKLGVGEQVTFWFDPTIPNLVWPDILWDTTMGSVGTTEDGTMMYFTAPSNAAKATITITVKGQRLKERFTVVEPSGIATNTYIVNAFINPPNQGFYPGESGAGMYLRVYIAPTDVSFYRLQCLEIGLNATNVTGYFTNNPPWNTANLSHIGHGADVPFKIDPDNSWEHGTPGRDWDQASWHNYDPPPAWSAGSLKWNIPGAWSIANSGIWHTNMFWDQNFTSDAAGTVTVTKFGHTVTRTTNNVYTTIH